MTKKLEILDSLPGSGKTYAIFNYMEQDQSRPWLYLSPMKDEINTRVPEEAQRVNMEFQIPEEGKGTLSLQVLDYFREGKNVACTHALTMHFSTEHIQLIRDMKYRVVCDEELDLIGAFELKAADVDFLLHEEMISVDYENFGKVTFNKQEMSYEAKYGQTKLLCDRGCLFMSKRSTSMLVSYLSPDLILASDRFILLTYNFGGSIMQAFLALHEISTETLDIPLYKTTGQVKEQLRELFTFVDSPSIRKIQEEYPLTKSWWTFNTKGAAPNVINLKKKISGVIQNSGVNTEDIFLTCPVDHFPKLKGGRIREEHFIAYNKRATNQYSNRKLAIHAYNLYMNLAVKSYLQDYGFIINEDSYALNQAIQWVFRGCIRKGERMSLVFLSQRMQSVFKDWLSQV